MQPSLLSVIEVQAPAGDILLSCLFRLNKPTKLIVDTNHSCFDQWII
jgi:hypothetical protein